MIADSTTSIARACVLELGFDNSRRMCMRKLNVMLALVVLGGCLTLLSASAIASRAAPMGDDGLHKPEWFDVTFRDVQEDLDDATAAGKRLVIVFEQIDCSYCSKMHETVLADPQVIDYLKKHYSIVQYNLYGDDEVVDLDGEVLSEKTAAAKWGVMFTPNWFFLPTESDGTKSVKDAVVGSMPGAFAKGTFLDLFTWVNELGYETDEDFQRYHSRMVAERQAAAKLTGETAASD